MYYKALYSTLNIVLVQNKYINVMILLICQFNCKNLII